MNVSAPMAIDLERERAELETVLGSKHFLRAPRLAHLLSYLCEQRFAGESGKIKEYSIGVEVFRRGEAFDQDSDSIVRVEANRLRKRLAEYYSSDGAEHQLQITIPLGQYVPEFRASVPAQPPPVTPADSPEAEAPGRKRKALSVYLASAAVLLCLLAAGVWLLLRATQPPPLRLSSSEPVASLDPLFGPPVGDEVRILCGAAHSLVDHAGKLWAADMHFAGGVAGRSPTQHIEGTLDPAFYRTFRQGDFRYDIPLKPGQYELRLHFAETAYGPEFGAGGGEGSRLMRVSANGTLLLDAFDIVTDAAGSGVADVKVFPGLRPAKDGKLHLEFHGEQGKMATVSALEILPGLRNRMRPVRILTRQSPYYSNDSRWWSPDAYFDGGQLSTYGSATRGTDEPEMFESERWGNFSYAIPASPGRYAVTLYFVARHGAWPPAGGEGPAPHIFNVFCNGRTILQQFDPAREAGPSDVVIRKTTGLQPNAQGKLVLNFVPVKGYATITAIEMVAQ